MLDPNAHVPGPWKHFYSKAPRGHHAEINGIDDDRGNCVVHWSGFDASAFTPPQRRANAQLIAAAPELLDALRAMVSCEYGTAEALSATRAARALIRRLSSTHGAK